MSRLIIISTVIVAALIAGAYFISTAASEKDPYCLTGAFIGDKPTTALIRDFKNSYGKQPYFVMTFVDWGRYVDKDIIKDVYSAGSVLMVTWEPWDAQTKELIDYEALMKGKYDPYIEEFASRIKAVDKDVYIRFAHEMNGDWYPWSAAKIGAYRYIAMYKYMKDAFDRAEARNARWVFSINWEDVPAGNSFESAYPGGTYVDYFGIDGYNWGDTQSWSKWMTFEQLFKKRYDEIASTFEAPIIITEFGSTSHGGNKARWIRDAMSNMKKMCRIRGFILFNVNKETDWGFAAGSECEKDLQKALADAYFKHFIRP